MCYILIQIKRLGYRILYKMSEPGWLLPLASSLCQAKPTSNWLQPYGGPERGIDWSVLI